jgi:putative phosphoesterase
MRIKCDLYICNLLKIMKFAIVSDTHDNTANFNKVINFLHTQKIETMLHCGDICNQDTIDESIKNFKGQIHFVRGNGDFDLHTIPEKNGYTIRW